jgi:hypothetical protein
MYIMENITISETDDQTILPPLTPTDPVSFSGDEQPQETSSPYTQSLTQIEIKNENIALNVIVSFLNLAQKRGAFGIDESAKIWECIKVFIQR